MSGDLLVLKSAVKQTHAKLESEPRERKKRGIANAKKNIEDGKTETRHRSKQSGNCSRDGGTPNFYMYSEASSPGKGQIARVCNIIHDRTSIVLQEEATRREASD